MPLTARTEGRGRTSRPPSTKGAPSGKDVADEPCRLPGLHVWMTGARRGGLGGNRGRSPVDAGWHEWQVNWAAHGDAEDWRVLGGFQTVVAPLQ